MTFYSYMMKTHRGMENGAGKLADVMASDREHFPRNGPLKYEGWHKLIRDHIFRSPAYAGMVPVFETCWEQYEQNEREKRRRYRNARKAD